MTIDVLNDILLADVLGGLVNPLRSESGEIIGYAMTEFGSAVLAYDEAKAIYGEGVT